MSEEPSTGHQQTGGVAWPRVTVEATTHYVVRCLAEGGWGADGSLEGGRPLGESGGAMARIAATYTRTFRYEGDGAAGPDAAVAMRVTIPKA